MARPIQEPMTVPDGRDGTKTTHPAFGQITVHRVQGSIDLYGSDFTHHSYVSVAIHTSEMHRSLANDWHFASGELIEVSLSEAQWATFVSSFNIGAGVPCTLSHREGKTIPAIPRRSSFSLYAEEAAGSLSEAIERLGKCEQDVIAATSKLSKKAQAEVLAPLRDAISTLTSTLPFVKQQFDEHVEASVEKAKVEVNAYMLNVVRDSGIAALRNAPAPPLVIEGTKK